MYRPAECFTTSYEVLSSSHSSTMENKNTKVDISQSLVNMYHTHTRDKMWGGGRLFLITITIALSIIHLNEPTSQAEI